MAQRPIEETTTSLIQTFLDIVQTLSLPEEERKILMESLTRVFRVVGCTVDRVQEENRWLRKYYRLAKQQEAKKPKEIALAKAPLPCVNPKRDRLSVLKAAWLEIVSSFKGLYRAICYKNV